MEVHTPSQMSFPRSPGVHNLAAYDPKQDPRSVKEVTVMSFAGESFESSITHPKLARPLIRRYSELLDPTQLDSQRVKRSSGNMFTGSTYNLNLREIVRRICAEGEKKKKEQEMAEGDGCKKNSAKISEEGASTQRGAALALNVIGVWSQT
ncbi:hypothetical protein E4T50_03384 [Aureobasidium sp. EXF-12298]|nr:hypothetical protein E4T50_03384 [Aureobasidium sp. EXF-12298]